MTVNPGDSQTGSVAAPCRSLPGVRLRPRQSHAVRPRPPQGLPLACRGRRARVSRRRAYHPGVQGHLRKPRPLPGPRHETTHRLFHSRLALRKPSLAHMVGQGQGTVEFLEFDWRGAMPGVLEHRAQPAWARPWLSVPPAETSSGISGAVPRLPPRPGRPPRRYPVLDIAASNGCGPMGNSESGRAVGFGCGAGGGGDERMRGVRRGVWEGVAGKVGSPAPAR